MESIVKLEKDGVSNHPRNIMVSLFEYFLASDYSQTNYHKGEIASLKYILSKFDQSDSIIKEIDETLFKLYSRYFKDVKVSSDLHYENDAIIDVVIDLDVITDDGEKLSLARVVNVDEINNVFENQYIEQYRKLRGEV